MKNKKFVLLVCAALVAALACCAFAGCSKDKKSDGPAEGQVTVTVAIESATDAVTIEPQTATVYVAADATVYDALLATGWDVVAEDSDWGKYVHSIAGNADGANYAWVYLVNGESAMDGASLHTVADGDTYTWQMISW